MKIKKLFYSPFKSCAMMNTEQLVVQQGIGIVGDRNFALVRMLNEDAAIAFQNKREARNIVNYFSLKSTPVLNRYSFRIEEKIITLYKKNKKIASTIHKDFASLQTIARAFQQEEQIQDQKIFLVYNKEIPFFDTVQHNTISLINLNSLKDFNARNSLTIDLERFRANIYIDGVDPFQEQEWEGKQISIDGKLFDVFATIPRCKATHYPYGSQEADCNVPQLLQQTYKHVDLGVYLRPSNNAVITKHSTMIIK